MSCPETGSPPPPFLVELVGGCQPRSAAKWPAFPCISAKLTMSCARLADHLLPATCFTSTLFGNSSSILTKGLSCKDHDSPSSVQPDVPEAASYFIQGLAIENDRRDVWSPSSERSSPTADEINYEVLQDIAVALCSLYRHGKIQPHHEAVEAQTHVWQQYTDKGRAAAAAGAQESAEAQRDGHRATHPRRGSAYEKNALWEEGGETSKPLVRKLEVILGLRTHDPAWAPGSEEVTLTGKPLSSSPPSATLETVGRPADSSSSIRSPPPPPMGRRTKKSVSFSRLPAAARPSLNLIAVKQARTALIHLYYILALVTFSTGTKPHRSCTIPAPSKAQTRAKAKQYWEKIVQLAATVGTSGLSRESEELVSKAQARIDMLSCVQEESEGKSTPPGLVPSCNSSSSSGSPFPPEQSLTTNGGQNQLHHSSGAKASTDDSERPAAASGIGLPPRAPVVTIGQLLSPPIATFDDDGASPFHLRLTRELSSGAATIASSHSTHPHNLHAVDHGGRSSTPLSTSGSPPEEGRFRLVDTPFVAGPEQKSQVGTLSQRPATAAAMGSSKAAKAKKKNKAKQKASSNALRTAAVAATAPNNDDDATPPPLPDLPSSEPNPPAENAAAPKIFDHPPPSTDPERRTESLEGTTSDVHATSPPTVDADHPHGRLSNQPVENLAAHPASAGELETPNANTLQPRRAKFSIPDSPTSTIRSSSSLQVINDRASLRLNGITRPRGDSDASHISGVSSIAVDTKGKGKDTASHRRPNNGRAPWLIRRASSSTGISHDQHDATRFPSSSSSRQLANGARIQGCTGLRYCGASGRSPAKPKFIGNKWSASSTVPTLQVSDARTSVLGPDQHYQAAVNTHELEYNAASVLSLPHSSTSAGAKSFSAAHLLLNKSASRSSLKRSQGSSSSLVSLGGIQRSFSSLRNFFLPASSNPLQDSIDEDGMSDEADDDVAARRLAAEEAKKKEQERQKLRAKLERIGQRHDEAATQYVYWDNDDHTSMASDQGSFPDSPDRRERFAYVGVHGEDEENAETAHDNGKQQSLPAPTTAFGVPASAPKSSSSEAQNATGSPSKSLSSSPGKYLRPLSHSIPSSSLILPKSRRPVPAAPPTTPAAAIRRRTPAEREARRSRLKERQSASSLLSISVTERKGAGAQSDRSSAESSTVHTPSKERTQDEIFGAPGPLKIDPLLAALEAASRVNVKTRCAVCGKQGINFPKCQKCGMTFCSRECRTSTVAGAAGGRHACVA